MPVFLHNLGLDFMAEKGRLLDSYMVPLFDSGRDRICREGRYRTALLPSGVEFIFHLVEDGGDVRVVGVDTHVGGPCVWYGTPFLLLDAGSDPLAMRLACTNEAKSAVFVANIMNAGVLPAIDESTRLELQVAGFPAALEVYRSRADYEGAMTEAARAAGGGTPVIISDGQPLPYNFIIKNNPEASDADRERAGRDDLLLLCGPVLAVEERSHGISGHEDASMVVATIATAFGHLDVVFVPDMLAGNSCAKGDYLVTECVLSADVALGWFDRWEDR